MRTIKCRLEYHKSKLTALAPFALGVRDGIYNNNPPFMAPPLMQPIFEGLITDYSNKYAAYKAHTETKAEMEIAKGSLMTGLDTMSNYVNTVANGDANIIGQAGFVPTKGSASQQNPPAEPTGITLNRLGAGELVSDCPVVEGAEFYCAVLTQSPIPASIIMVNGQIVLNEGGATPSPTPMPGPTPSGIGIIDFNKSRRKIFIGLTPGITYYIYYWAGNTAGVSPLSQVVSFMLW